MSRVKADLVTVPSETTVLGLLERNARTAVTRSGEVAKFAARSLAPHSRGRRRQGPGRSPGGLEGSIDAKVKRTPTGVRSTTTFDRRKAFYGGFAEAGTVHMEGTFYLRRTELAGMDAADRLIEDGADDAGRELGRLL